MNSEAKTIAQGIIDAVRQGEKEVRISARYASVLAHDYFALREALSKQFPPEGYVVVPREPTEKMVKAGRREYSDWESHSDGSPYNVRGYARIYKAMIAAVEGEIP